MFGQECENQSRDLVVLLVEREMAGIEQMDFGVRQIALVGLASGRDERGSLLIPGSRETARRLSSGLTECLTKG